MKVYIPVVKYEVRTIDVNTDIPLSDDVKALEWLKANTPGWDDEGGAIWDKLSDGFEIDYDQLREVDANWMSY